MGYARWWDGWGGGGGVYGEVCSKGVECCCVCVYLCVCVYARMFFLVPMSMRGDAWRIVNGQEEGRRVSLEKPMRGSLVTEGLHRGGAKDIV